MLRLSARAAILALAVHAVPAMAQSGIPVGFPAGSTVLPRAPLSVTADSAPVVHAYGPSLKVLGLATVATTSLLLPLDVRIERAAHELRGTGHDPLGPAASTLNWIGDPGTVIAPIALTTIGWLSHQPTVTTLGMRTMESVVLSAGVTGLLKGTAGRNRPSPSGSDADDFAFRAGFSRGATSFPSGHATAAFALATSLTAEIHRTHPQATWLVGLASYGVATGVGMARVYTNHHWSSDVALGAGIGTMTALLVDRITHSTTPRHGLLAWLR